MIGVKDIFERNIIILDIHYYTTAAPNPQSTHIHIYKHFCTHTELK